MRPTVAPALLVLVAGCGGDAALHFIQGVWIPEEELLAAQDAYWDGWTAVRWRERRKAGLDAVAQAFAQTAR